MSDQLIENLENISSQKLTYLLPENIKKDVTVLGVTGTYEGLSGEPFDWSNLGYSSAVDNSLDNVQYSWNIMKNWDSSGSSMRSKFYEDTDLVYMPLVDTSNVTTMRSCFRACTNLEYVPLLDTSNVESFYCIFYEVPKLTEIPLFNTSNVSDFRYAFQSATRLVTVPALDTSKATQLDGMFNSCSSLSNNSLINILSMCTGAIVYTGTKTLAHLGLTSTQANTCTGLSNWSAAQAAGWSTGY